MECFIQLEKFELKASFITNWKHRVTRNKKILLYKSVKFNFTYIFRIKNKRNRSLLARLMARCLDLEIEIGRWHGIDRENRICKLCSNGIEN